MLLILADARNRDVLSAALDGQFLVETAGDADAGFDSARAIRPDVIVVDTPASGLIERLRGDEALADVPVVEFGGPDTAAQVGGDACAGVTSVQPVNARELLVCVSALVEAGRLRGVSRGAQRDSEHRYRVIVESQAEMVCRFRPDGEILFVNSAYARSLDSTPEALTGCSFWQFIPEGDRPAVRGMLAALTPEHPAATIENRFETSEGERWTLWTNRALTFDASGAALELQSTGIDITERKRTEQLLRASEKQFRDMADAAPAMLWMTDPGGSCVFLSRAWYEYTGQTEKQGMGIGWTDATHPDDREAAARVFLQANQRREPFALHYRLLRNDGEYRWAIDAGRPRFSDDGEFLGFIGSVIDIHAFKQSEEALRQSDERFKAIFGQTNAGVAQTDLTGRFALVNATYCSIVQRSAEELASLRMQDITHPDDLPRNVALLERLLSQREPFAIEKRYRLPDGSHVWVNAHVAVVNGADGEPSAVVAVVQDITQRKHAEEVLRHADRRKDDFLATLSHELRNPLAPLRNAFHILRRTDGVHASAAAVHAMMERQVEHLVRLVDDLLELSRISRGTLELRKERVSAASIIRNALETSDPLIKAARHELTVTLPDEPIWLDGDPVRLAQILANLLNNAAKYTREGGRIELGLSQSGGTVAMTVRDNGIGISADALPGVFEMFSRGDRERLRGEDGLGVGLALSLQLAEMHGGTITAASGGVGRGAEFSLLLPLCLEAPDATTPRTAAGAAGIHSLRILIVDDNADAAESLSLNMQLLGADTRVAHDGFRALDAVATGDPDVVILDIGMPGLDGYEVARRIRARSSSRPVLLIALSGWGQEPDLRRAREAGFDHHLIKPADIDSLHSLLASCVGSTVVVEP